MLVRAALTIKGIVQGVGFRPYIYRLANEYCLKGFVFNAPEGVICEVEGERESVMHFIADIPLYKPEAADISGLEYSFINLKHDNAFSIQHTKEHGTQTVISPDLAICAKCKEELFDRSNRRFEYPFINCTDCGPRFSIIHSMPYDRENTSMQDFDLCIDCDEEYSSPVDRRFHAEPNACAVCGPEITVYDSLHNIVHADWLDTACEYLNNGKIVAIKGIGGYHLAVDAMNEDAVKSLRQKKHRYAKPLAVMVRDITTAESFCYIDEQEKAELLSKAAPIVVLKKRENCNIAPSVSESKNSLGLFLPYTAMHCLLMERIPAIVLTSANVSDEPICRTEDEAFEKLFDIADLFITHNREIVHACDDSVLQFCAGNKQLIRRSRGYAPAAVTFKGRKIDMLACGGEQKNCFALSKGNNAFLSAHIGDLHNYDAYLRYENEITELCRIMEISPEIVICDMHPDYASTHYASKNDKKIMKIQHHHAHFASVLAENDYEEKAIGVIFDGTGFGEDGTMWGSEFLTGNCVKSERAAHLAEFNLLGSETAIKEPWRLALELINRSCAKNELYKFMYELPENAALLLLKQDWQKSCGMGRLFDGVAAILDIKRIAEYEGQAAEILENYAASVGNQTDIILQFDIIKEDNGKILIDWRPVIREIMHEMQNKTDIASIALAFHNALAEMVLNVCQELSAIHNIRTVALSGGCFQNKLLLSKSLELLQSAGFLVLLNKNIPCNDGGLAYGQLAAAAAMLEQEE